MEITGLTLAQFRECADAVSAETYSRNIITHNSAHDQPASRNGTPRCTARLTVTGSRGPGSRTTAFGQHGLYACWHAYRDVLAEVFRRYPNAVIRAGSSWRVTYRGRAGFEELYPETASIVIGSVINPVTMPELCACEHVSRNGYGEPVYTTDLNSRIAPEHTDPSPDYVSPAVRQASEAYAASAQLLGEGDKPADPIVFGPE